MRKHFLLMFLLALLPLVGWAHNASWSSGNSTEEFTYSGTQPSFALTVTNSYNGATCTYNTSSNSYPTGNNNRYNLAIYDTQAHATSGGDTGMQSWGSVVNQGTYWLRVSIHAQYKNGGAGSNYNSDVKVLQFKINPIVADIELFEVDKNYGENDPAVSSFTADNYKITGAAWSDIVDLIQFKRVTNGEDAGQYAYTVEKKSGVDAPENFTLHIDPSGAFLNIKAVAGKLNAPTPKTGMTYTGQEQELFAAPALGSYVHDGGMFAGDSAGDIEYSIDGGLNWSTEIPKGKDAGNYTVYYRGKGDANHTDLQNNTIYRVNVNIGKATITDIADWADSFTAPTAVTADLTYDGDYKVLTTDATILDTDVFKNATVTYNTDDTGGWSTVNKRAINAGMHRVRYRITGATNFENYELPAADAIQKEILRAQPGAITGIAAVTNLIYTLDTEQNLVTAGSSANAVIWYSLDHGTWTTTVPKAEHFKEGGYTVEWYAKGNDPNYGNIGSQEEPAGKIEGIMIAKRQFAVKTDATPATGLIYNAEALELVATDVIGGATGMPAEAVSWTLDGEAVTGNYKNVKATNAKTSYTVGYTVVPASDTYKDDYIPYTKTLTVAIGKAGLDIAAQSLTVGWTGTPVEAGQLVKVDEKDIPAAETAEVRAGLAAALAGFKENGFKEVLAGGAEQVVTPIPSKAGDYKFELEAKTHENYEINDFVPNGTLTITKANAVAAVVEAADLTYTGEDLELVNVDESGMVGVETMLYFLDEGAGAPPAGDARWKAELPKATDAKVAPDAYKVWYMAKGDENHNDVAAASVDVVIKQKPLDNAMFALTPTNLVYTGADRKAEVNVTATDELGEKNVITTGDFEETKVEYDGAEVEKLINAGVYTYTFTGKKNYTGTATATIEIGQKELNADMFVFSADVEYNGEFQKPTITYKDEEPIVLTDDYTFAVTYGDPAAAIDVDKLIDADTYTFTFTATADGNYKNPAAPATVTKEWKITKKALTTDMFVLNGENPVEFDGSDQIPGFTLKAGEPIKPADFTPATTVKVDEVATAVTEMIDADTYTYTFTATADGNYSGEVSIDFVIEQATAEIVEPEFNYLTYKNEDQALVTEGTTDAVAGSATEPAGKVEYQVIQVGDEEETVFVDWTDKYEDVVALHAGNYKVKYKITASAKNYTNPKVEGTANVKIEKAEILYSLTNIEKVWDGAPFDEAQINSLFAISNGELFGTDKYERPFEFVLPEEYKDAGIYTFTQPDVKFGEFEDYDVKFQGTAEVKINKKDIAASDYTEPFANELTFDSSKEEEGQALVTAGTVKTTYLFDGAEEATPIGTIYYAIADEAPALRDSEGNIDPTVWSKDVPTGFAADDYTVWYFVAGDKNHNDVEAADIAVTIAPLEVEFALAFEDAEVTYDGHNYKADLDLSAKEAEEAEAALIEGTDYELTINGEAAADVDLINVGTYEFVYTGKGNYEGSEATRTIVINPVNLEDIEIALSKTETNYNAEDQKPTYTLTYQPEGKPALTLAENTDFEVDAEEKFINAGTYTFTFSAVADGNYTGEATAEFVIHKLPLMVTAPDATKTYDGTVGLENAEIGDPDYKGLLVGDEIDLGEGKTIADYLTVVEPSKNQGPYTIKIAGEFPEQTNYEISSTIDGTLTIAKAAAIEVSFAEGFKFEKTYGAADPDKFTATAANLEVTDGEFFDTMAEIAAQITITRDAADTDSYGLHEGVMIIAKAAEAPVFANYEDVTFVPGDLDIAKAAIDVAVADQEKVYNGEFAVAEVSTANLTVVGLVNDDTVEGVFGENLPTATVGDGEAKNAGKYNITLEGEVANYTVNYIPSFYTIKKATITEVTITEQNIVAGSTIEGNIDPTLFTAKGLLDADKAAFAVDVALALTDGDDEITAGAGEYADGLVLVAIDDEIAANYKGWEEATGKLIILGAEPIVLSDADAVVTEAKAEQTVTFSSRTINTNTWNVMVLPFETTPAQISDAFGFAAVDVLNETASDGAIHFTLLTSGTIAAGQPFIVKPTEDYNAKENFNQVVFYNVDIEAFSDNTYRQDGANNKFWGTFKTTEFAGAEYWYMSKGMWKDAKKYKEQGKVVTLKPLRAYVEFAPENVATARIFIEEPDGTTTALDAVEFNNMINGEGWYTIDGKKLDAAPTQKGVYINNGKKVVVK